MTGYFEPDRIAIIYTADHLDDARAMFLCRPHRALDYDHRDVQRQKDRLRSEFSGMDTVVDRWLEEVERTPTFSFDAITQLEMTTWSSGRVTLVMPLPLVPRSAAARASPSTYVLAGESQRRAAITRPRTRTTNAPIMPAVIGSRSLARVNAKTLVPEAAGPCGLSSVSLALSVLPLWVTQSLARLNRKGIRLREDNMPLADYPTVANRT